MVTRAFFSVLISTALLAAQGAGSIAWEGDFDTALRKAKEENRPIMVAFTMKNESANDAVRKRHFHDAKIVALSERFVCLDALQGTEVEQEARTTWIDAPTVSAPQFLFLKPDGKSVLLRHVWMLPAAELLKKMKTALAYFDPSTADPEFRRMKDQVTLLLKDAAGNNLAERRAALTTLGSMDDPRIMPFLVRQSGRGIDSQKRLEAIFFMGKEGNAKALDCLHALLADKDTEVKNYAAFALERIAMKESIPHLLKSMKRARKERLRANLVRALSACGKDDPELRKVLVKMLKSRSESDLVTALWVCRELEPGKDLPKPVIKTVSNRKAQVRCAAYLTVGTWALKQAGKALKSRHRTERGEAKECCEWALTQLGMMPSYTGETDPQKLVRDQLTDQYLRDGELDQGGRGGRGGRGGGRGGRGGRR